MTCTTSAPAASPLLDEPGGDVVLAEHLDMRWAGPWPGVHDDDAGRRRRSQPRMSATARSHVAAVGLGGLRRQRSGSATPGDLRRRRHVGRRRSVSSPNGLTVHHAWPRAERVRADVGERAVATRRRGRSAPVPPPAAAAQRGAEELLAGRDQVVRAGAGPLGVEHQHVGVGRQQVDEQLHLVDERRGQRLHALDGDAVGDLVGELEQLRVRLAQLGGAARVPRR